MSRKLYRPDEIVAKLCDVEALLGDRKECARACMSVTCGRRPDSLTATVQRL